MADAARAEKLYKGVCLVRLHDHLDDRLIRMFRAIVARPSPSAAVRARYSKCRVGGCVRRSCYNGTDRAKWWRPSRWRWCQPGRWSHWGRTKTRTTRRSSSSTLTRDRNGYGSRDQCKRSLCGSGCRA